MIENKQLIFKEGTVTHIVFEWDTINNKPLCESAKLYTDLKDATSETEAKIKTEPGKKYRVFQLRTILEGRVAIDREDFNS